MSGFSDTQYAKCCWRRGSAYRRKWNIVCVCVNLQKFTDWVSSCFKMLLESWCNKMCTERKTGIFCNDWSVLLCSELMLHSLTLPALFFCSSLSQSISLQFSGASAGVVSQFSKRRLLLQDLFCALLGKAVHGQHRQCGWFQLLTSLTSAVC